MRQAIVDVCEAPDPDLSCPVTRDGTESLGDLLDIASRPPFAGDALVESKVTLARDDVRVIAEELAQEVVTTVDVNLDLSASATIKDFEKYVGVDVGAMYLPALDELRSFATVNVYFGPVEDSPAPLESAKADGTMEKKWRRAFQQRFSLTFGVSTGDISGRSGESTFKNNQDKATVKGDNVFLYGAGFRLNKYIRLTTGGAVFRNASDNTLNNVFFVGPSIDLTGLKFLRTLAGKNK